MILKSAIKRYLTAPRDDHRWLKELDHRDVDKLINSLYPRPKLHPKMRLHQKVAFYLGVAYPQFCYWLDMGTGKTLLSLELIKYWMQVERFKKAFVFVLSDKAFPTWEAQNREYDIGLPMIALEGSSEEKWNQLRNFDRGIVLSTYMGTLAMCSIKGIKKRGNRKVTGLLLVKNMIDELCEDTGVLVLDESTKVGHSTSLLHKMALLMSKNIPIRYALAGRPFGRDPMLMYNQHLIIDRAETFGHKTFFQQAFFSRSRNHFAKSRYSYNFQFKKKMLPELTRIMQHRSITYAAKECVDLPPVNRIRAPVSFSKESQTYYKEAAKALLGSKGDWQETKNLFLRMRQITSGFLGFKNDDNGERAQIAFSVNPKLDKLQDLIEELPEDRKAIIFYEFTWSAQQISKRLKELKLKHVWLWAGTKNSRQAQEQFQEDPECRFMILQNKIGAYSLDGLQKVANYGFIYESPVACIDREQLEHRLIRQGQKWRVFLYDLMVPNSVDERILEFHKEGQDIMEAIRANPKAIFQ